MDKSKWEYKKLGEVATFIGGGTPSKSKKEYYEGNIPWATVRDMTSFLLNKTEYKITNDAVDNSATNIIPKGTIVISTHVGLGKICELQQDTAINQDLKAVYLIGDINKRYFSYWYKSISDYIISNGKGATVKGVTLNFIKNLRFPIPPLSTQHQIVSELDQLSDLISLKQQQIKEYDALAQSLFYEMFGDPINSSKFELKKIDDIYKVSSSKRIYKEELTNSGVPFLKVADIVQKIKGLNISPESYITEEKYKELGNKGNVPNYKDILITSRGTLGECYIVKINDKFYFQDGMITWLKLKDGLEMEPIYLVQLFKIPSFKKYLDSLSNGNTVAFLSISKIGKLNIPLPPLSLQQSFASKVQSIEHQKSLLKQSIAETQTLLDSRMQEYFG